MIRLRRVLGVGGLVWLLAGTSWATSGVVVLTRALHHGWVTFRAEIDDAAEVPATVTLAWGLTQGGDTAATWENRTTFAVSSVGLITTNIALPDSTVIYYRWFAETPTGSYAPAPVSLTTARAQPVNNITFVTASDIHVTTDAVTVAAVNKGIEHINALAGKTYPTGIGLDGVTVDPPRGIILLGDLIDSGAKFSTQWPVYTNLFGLVGDKRLAYPVYDGWGNHDLGSDLVANQIKARNLRRFDPLTNVSTNGYHYSWDWDFLHLVQLNLFPGDVNDSVKGYDPKMSLSYLKNDLARCVGTSGRPVAIFMHYDVNDLGWWNDSEHQLFYDAISNYNVICIVYGHTGTGLGTWNNGGTGKKFRTVNDGNEQARSFIFNVTSNRLSVASWEVGNNAWYTTRQCKDTITVGNWQETLDLTSITNTTPAGARENVGFAASATNNYGRVVEFRYIWGNNVTSAWGEAVRTNLWDNPGAFNVRVQARCASNTNLASGWMTLPMTIPLRFQRWATEHGLSGDTASEFQNDADHNGVPDGVEYAFGDNWSNGVPAIDVRMVGGRPIVEVPVTDSLRSSARVQVEVSGDLSNPGGWETNVVPSEVTAGKPSNRQWLKPGIDGDVRFFRLRGELVP